MTLRFSSHLNLEGRVSMSGLRFLELLPKLLQLSVLVLQIKRIRFSKDIGRLHISSGLLQIVLHDLSSLLAMVSSTSLPASFSFVALSPRKTGSTDRGHKAPCHNGPTEKDIAGLGQ